ncbi:MAG: hypothetical protein MJA27_04165, partial [Pseudanabaenales cyanobacterium]|nr:hypothetical protein [Pseudanabaenales cyanobacterium]
MAPDAETLDSAKGHASDGDDGGTVTSPPEPRPLNLEPHSYHHYPHDNTHHTHTHGAIDPEIATSARGLWAVQMVLVQALNSVRARWLGHRLYVEVAIAVAPDLSI